MRTRKFAFEIYWPLAMPLSFYQSPSLEGLLHQAILMLGSDINLLFGKVLLPSFCSLVTNFDISYDEFEINAKLFDHN